MIVVHDPQPLGLTTSRRDRSLLCISLYGFVVLPEDLLQRNRLFNALQEIVAENLSTPSPRAPHRLPPPLAPQLNHATAPSPPAIMISLNGPLTRLYWCRLPGLVLCSLPRSNPGNLGIGTALACDSSSQRCPDFRSGGKADTPPT